MEAPSTVWMVPVDNGEDIEALKRKTALLLEKSDFQQAMSLQEGETIAVKMHFGEINTNGYIKPPVAKVVIDRIKEHRARPFLAETAAVYIGGRRSAVEHLELAWRHGFDISTVGAPVIILDGVHGENSSSIQVNKKHFKEIHVAGGILRVEGLVGLAHFKGHELAGFGGALKNIAMGLASPIGKVRQHINVKPFVLKERCIFCRKCAQSCPVNAVKERNNKAFIDKYICIGCGECVVACPESAISFDWREGVVPFTEKMMEYAFGILKTVKKTYFINCAYKITKFCDCIGCENPAIAPDIGIFASRDPLALDKATNDLVLGQAGKDIWKEHHPQCEWKRKLEYAQELGIGQLEYKLQRISE